jgi:hypothetical protein
VCSLHGNYQKLLQIHTHRIGIQIRIQTRVRVLMTKGEKINIFYSPQALQREHTAGTFEIEKKIVSHPKKEKPKFFVLYTQSQF